MKTIIFSDTHLTKKFNKKKYNFLVNLINSADQIIINGDFWDSWFVSFDSFVKSKWKNLFPLLLYKNTIYIHGNHDPKFKINYLVKLFSLNNVDSYVLKSGHRTFLIKHGNLPLVDSGSRILKIYGQILEKARLSFWKKIVNTTVVTLEWISFNLLGSERMTDSKISKLRNSLQKQLLTNSKQWLICGDTHRPEIDRKYMFANSGNINFGFASYLIIENGKIHLHKEKYRHRLQYKSDK